MEKPWHQQSLTELFRFFHSRKEGLPEKEIQEKLAEYGYNKLEEEKKESPLTIFLDQFRDFLIIILLSATLISLALGEILDGLIILAIVLLSAILGFFQEYRSQKAIEALKKMVAPEAEVLRDGKALRVAAETLVPGDILLLKVGDKVAADARVIEEAGLEVDEAILTGESLPVKKENLVFSAEGIALGDRKNMLYSGTIITRGHGRALVVATGMKTEFGKIAGLIAQIQPEKTPLEKRLESVGKVLAISALAICALVSLMGVLRGQPLIKMFLWGVSLAVAAVPEALPAVVTSSLSIGVWEMAKRKAIVKKLSAVETLGSVSIICSDKTGTLTKNEMTVKEIFLDGKRILVEGSGYSPEGTFLLTKGDYDFRQDKDFQLFCQIALLCNDASLRQKGKEWLVEGDPTEGALVVMAAKAGFLQERIQKQFPRLGEVAFEMERKRMSTLHSYKDKYLVAVKGAPESVLSCCKFLQINGKIIKLSSQKRKKFLLQTRGMAKGALRVLGFAYKEVGKNQLANFKKLEASEVENELVFVGLAGMFDPPREEAAEAVRLCFQAGIKPIIVTGDHPLTAWAVGQRIGLFSKNTKEEIIEGAQLDKISDRELLKIVEKRSYARVSPSHKLRIIEALKKKHYVVAMTGDGINDAPALKKADIGVAMGITGTDVTKEAADMILADDNFATIVVAVKKGREIFDNIKKYLFYLLRCNIGEILVLGGGFFLGLPPILSAIQILWINLATDGLPAIALGVDPPATDVMQRKPVAPAESFFNRESTAMMFLLAVNMFLVLILEFVFLRPRLGLLKTQTLVFLTMVFMEMVSSFVGRTESSIFKINPFANKWLNWAVLFSSLITIIIIQYPQLSLVFDTTALKAGEMLLALALSFSVVIVSETGKHLLRLN